MTTWTHVRSYLAERLRPVATDDDRLQLVLRFASTRRAVEVRHRHGGSIELTTVVGHESGFTQRAALLYNRTARIGALVLDRGELSLRCVLPLEALAPEMVPAYVEYVAREATRLAAKMESARTPRAVFDHLAE